MYSQCPDCQTRFRVTAEALRAAHGTVRCSRCGAAFDALDRLSDTLPPVAGTRRYVPAETTEPPVMIASASAPAAQAAEFHFSADDLEKVFVDVRDWQRQYGQESAQSAELESGGEEAPELVVDESLPLEDITLEGERIQIDGLEGFDELREALEREDQAVPEAHDRETAPRHEVPTEAPQAPAAAEVPVAARDAVATVAATRAARPDLAAVVPNRWRAAAAADAELAAAMEELEEPSATRHALAWTLGSLLLAIVLAAQLIHHYRQELVRHPQVGPALLAVYDKLGLPLAPNWDPRAFELRQWGNSDASSAAGRLSVRASITNRAAFAQPLPLLRLEIDDRFGGAVATRDFEPREYLKDPAMATRMLAAGASVEASLEIVDPGADAVGFRLDTCLRESTTQLRCAQGTG